MHELQELISVLLLYRSNFHVLHWNAVGKEFDSTHKNITAEYYDDCLETADIIAEMIARLGGNPPNSKEVLEIIESSDSDFLMIESGKLYDKDDIQKYSDVMLKGICRCIEKALEADEMKCTCNVGVKAELEGLHNKFDLQARYINARRKH